MSPCCAIPECGIIFSSTISGNTEIGYLLVTDILSSKVVDVEDETIALVEKRIFYVLDSLGLKIAKKADLSLRTEMIQLDNGEYLLNFEMTQGGKVLRSKREQLKSLQYMDVFVSEIGRAHV